MKNIGLATSLYDRQEAQLRKAGFEDIKLYADITIGRYAWAKRGYDYVGGADDASSVSQIFQDWAKGKHIQKPASGWPIFKSASDVANYKVPGVSMLGRDIQNRDVPSDMEMNAGKAFMLDKSYHSHGPWGAVKKLQE